VSAPPVVDASRRSDRDMPEERGRNRYVVLPPWKGTPIVWDPHDTQTVPLPDCSYLGGVFAAMENRDVTGLTVYITYDLNSLPSYGDDVVAVVLGDEWCRVPRYAQRVRAVFKTYGTQLAVAWDAVLGPTPYRLAALAQDARTAALGAPNRWAATTAALRRMVRRQPLRHTIFTIPLGYYRQTQVPFVPIDERRFDSYFGGSVTQRGGSRFALHRLSPKFLSRERMMKRLAAIAKHNPHVSIGTDLTASFQHTNDDDATRYSRTMMDTKICVVPRGTSLETYRFFEALRFGCVVIAERLPQRWFYDGAPALRVRDWSELDRLVPSLLADPQRLAQLSAASLAWWAQCCSEDAVGDYLATRIRALGRSDMQPAEVAASPA
jgi:hypothetical protein